MKEDKSFESIDQKQEFYSSDLDQQTISDNTVSTENVVPLDTNTKNKKKSVFLILTCLAVCVVSIIILVVALAVNENGSFRSFISSTPFKAITGSATKEEKEEKVEEKVEEPEVSEPEEPETEEPVEAPVEESKKKKEEKAPEQQPTQPETPVPVNPPAEKPISREEQIRNNPDYIYYGYLDLPNNSNFNPDGTMTRAEFAKWIAIAMNLDTNANMSNPFNDLAGYEQYKNYILAVNKAGYMIGTGKGFLPGDKITRLQVLTVLVKIVEKNNLYPDEFCEELAFTDVSGNAAINTRKGSKYCITYGTTRTTFSPNEAINRKSVVLMIHRALKRDHPNMECVDDPEINFADVSSSSTYYKAIKEAAINHYCVYK